MQRDQLLSELAGVRRRVAESQTQHKRREEELKGTSDRLRRVMESAIQSMTFVVEIREPCTPNLQTQKEKIVMTIGRDNGKRSKNMRQRNLEDLGDTR